MSGRTVHPFPARMAPELVKQYIDGLRPNTTVLDPMMGSGSFAIAAAAAGHRAFGIDSDPLAHVIAEAASWVGADDEVLALAELIAAAPARDLKDMELDDETRGFVEFWFDPEAQKSLTALALGIKSVQRPLQAPLWCAFSRLIITKDAGASRARDVSHSRPHIVRDVASFFPSSRFVRSVRTVLARRSAISASTRDRLHLMKGDARALPLEEASVDAVMTSPPYLTAIDYLRGHRLSLVWMGHTLSSLRKLRGENIGSERGAALPEHLSCVKSDIIDGVVSRRRDRVLNRYLVDLDVLVGELSRVLRASGTATFVVANPQHTGASVRVDDALALVGPAHGMEEVLRSARKLPDNRRYLPTPVPGSSALGNRMRVETVLTLRKRDEPPV